MREPGRFCHRKGRMPLNRWQKGTGQQIGGCTDDSASGEILKGAMA
jgi:hypothetical protein